MEFLKNIADWFLNTASPETQISLLIVLCGGIFAFVKFIVPLIIRPPELRLEDAAPDTALIKMSLDEYEQRIADKIKVAEDKLETAHSEEKAQLLVQIEQLKIRAADPEAALAEARATITKLEAALERENNEHDISEARMTEARKALENGDFSIADDIFAEIEAREELAVQRTARAAFSRGEIAEAEIRWHDAAAHFEKSADLYATFKTCERAGKQNWLNGKPDKALHYVSKMKDLASTEEEKSFALNSEALLYRAQGKYDQAEPLYLQAIEIGKKTIGEQHPNYAIRLNNLANLYNEQSKYDQAEPLFLQAIEIDKKTIGEEHLDYAIRINNLAELYRAQGKYDQAEPLYLQAIEIGKKTIGEEHPNYAKHLNNLALLYDAQGKYDQAEPLYLQAIDIAMAALGADHPTTKTFEKNYQIFLQSKP